MATSHPATPAQAVLALYGALDQAAGTGNADLEATVAHFLPGSSGMHAGWYQQLLGFLGHREAPFTEPAAVPDLGQALDVLHDESVRAKALLQATKKASTKPTGTVQTGTARTVSAQTGSAQIPAKQPVSETTPEKHAVTPMAATGSAPVLPLVPRTLSTVQKARMVYAIATLSQLPGWYLQNELGAGWEQKFAQALQLAGGPADNGLLDHLRLHVNSRDGYPKVVELAVKKKLIDDKVALVPLCQPKLTVIRNHPCLVITTEFSSATVKLEDLKNVIDPVNWAKCLSTFFCQMDGNAECDDGWSRVLEQVSITCPIGPTHMKTALKYWKTDGQDKTQPPTACLDYELDDQPLKSAHGDGLIVVDEGFIRMTSTNAAHDATQPGVRIRTKKVVGFRNSALTPWGVLACSMGYGDQGVDMILDGVENCANNPQDFKGWTASTPPAKAPTQSKAPPVQTPPTSEPDTSRRAVELAVEMLNECVDDMSEKSAAVATKWASGAVPITEMIELNAEFTARVLTDPWRFLERLRKPAQGGDT